MGNQYCRIIQCVTSCTLTAFVVLYVFSVSACGNYHKHENQLLSLKQSPDTETKKITLDDTIKQIENFNPPISEIGDQKIHNMLKNELIIQLKLRESSTNSDHLISAAPTGDSGKVTNLRFHPATGKLSWTYMNIGDYDCSGEVGIPDITPIAINFLSPASTPGSLEYWIDGDKNGEVGISDITRIAQGYLNTVANYRIVTSDSVNGVFSPVGSLVMFGATGVFPKIFYVSLPDSAQSYIAVEPLDSSGNPGERSNVVSVSHTAPSIESISPTSGVTKTQITLESDITGTEPISYNWSFMGGVEPDTSTDATPVITLGTPGQYDGSLSVVNFYGEDTYDFQITITETPEAPAITGVSPSTGVTGKETTFVPLVTGTPPFTFYWDFGGGAEPNNSLEKSPSVILGAIGSYNVSLAVTNDEGGDTFNFSLKVTDECSQPSIIEVSPTAGAAGAQVRFKASVEGTGTFTYSWNFGGATAQNVSSDESPIVTLGSVGKYDASLTVTSEYGSDTLDWILDVGLPPLVTGVYPIEGTAGSTAKFTANTTGNQPISYTWDFGGGALPDTSTEQNPEVTLASSSGNYHAILTASNLYGTCNYPFTLAVYAPDSDGYTLYCPYLGSTDTFLIDMDGSVVHTWTSDYPPGACAKFRPNGNLVRLCDVGNPVFGGGRAGRIEERDWQDNIVWSYEISTNTECFHHDFTFLPNGNILLILWEKYSQAEALSAGKNPIYVNQDGVWMEKILEVQPVLPNEAMIVWEWNIFNHLIQDYDSTKPNYGNPADHPELMDFNYVKLAYADWLHANTVAYNPELDQIVLSIHGLSEIWIIDHSTTTEEATSHTGGKYGKGGDLLYRWGNPQVYRAGTEADKKLFAQHCSHWIAEGLDGAGNILVFNNNPGYPTGEQYSSIVEVTPPLNPDGTYYMTNGVYGPEEPTWIFISTPKTLFYSVNMSSVQRLIGGNTLICSAQQKWIFEVTPDGETVWEYHNPFPLSNPGSVFSALRYPYDFPGFAGMP